MYSSFWDETIGFTGVYHDLGLVFFTLKITDIETRYLMVFNQRLPSYFIHLYHIIRKKFNICRCSTMKYFSPIFITMHFIIKYKFISSYLVELTLIFPTYYNKYPYKKNTKSTGLVCIVLSFK